MVVALAKAVGEFALVPEHLDRRAVVVFDVQLGDHHLLRRVDLGQGHGLAIPVILGAGQCPVFGFCPLAAGPVGAFARSTFGRG
ncbi:hypothetical protein D3C81_2138730 [compost metagenome]